MTNFEQDQREANRILREWITDKTGTTDAERWWFWSQWAGKKFIQSISEMLAQASPSRGVEE